MPVQAWPPAQHLPAREQKSLKTGNEFYAKELHKSTLCTGRETIRPPEHGAHGAVSLLACEGSTMSGVVMEGSMSGSENGASPKQSPLRNPHRSLNGLHIVCPDGGGVLQLEEPRGSRSSRSRSSRGR